MASFTPIALSGDNLGQRHRHLNSLVREAKESGASVQDVETLAEESTVDHLFKIDLASELKHVDYITRNLKDDDMLYVSRALKAKWLIDRRDIINPKYLDEVLFPEMISPAVTKMKHWIYVNLRDPAMCQEFYQHYKENTFEFAIKFLSHCSHEFILEEAPKILTKLSTHSLKVLSEKCPSVAKIYFDSLGMDDELQTRYLERDQSYYESVKSVLKSDADVFLDITEKYFNMNSFSRLSPLATDYILRCHKTRFTNKLELYVAYLLHIPTLAVRLSVEECQEVVLKLAQASYLQHWFEYKVVEPLIQRLNPDKRAAFKRRVFVDKDVGDCGHYKWPFEIPISPMKSDNDHVFDDKDFLPIWPSTVQIRSPRNRWRPVNRSIGHQLTIICHGVVPYDSTVPEKTDLDRLFDEFRFVDFDCALQVLGQRLVAKISKDRRRDIFLVLVSKTGGRTDAVAALLRLAAREPPHTRAAILRSLVKRAKVWRLPADVWKHFLKFGHGLGLDGKRAKAACREGLHAVVIRQILSGKYNKVVLAAFMKDWSTLASELHNAGTTFTTRMYSLHEDERLCVAIGLQNIVTAAIIDLETKVAVDSLGLLLDLLKIYRIPVERTSPAVKAVLALVLRDAVIARPLLERLYNERIARRELLQLNMEFLKDEAALVNALRHDPSVLELKRVVDILAARGTSFDSFTSKLVVYFQKQNFTEDLRRALKEKIPSQQIEKVKNVKLARPLASLVYQDYEKELREFDAAGKEIAMFAAALRACAHRARPVVNLAEWGWRNVGVKAVATRAMRCRDIERAALTRALAAERRTVRVALALSMRSAKGFEIDIFASAAKLRPSIALRAALLYFHCHGKRSDFRVWDIIKPLFPVVDMAPRTPLVEILINTNWIPFTIKSDYCITLYLALYKIAHYDIKILLRELLKLLPQSDPQAIENLLLQILDDAQLYLKTLRNHNTIFVWYLLLSRNEEDVERKFNKIGNRYLEFLYTLRSIDEKEFQYELDESLKSLKYNSAFLDTKYTSCLLVIERILSWLQKFMPNEKNFKMYAQIYLTMLYFKATRQSIKQMPEVFADPKRKKSEGVEAVGFAFGRYIAKEVAELVSTYFDSIIELYTDALIKYWNCQFEIGTSRRQLIGFVLKGILAEGVGLQRRMVVHILGKEHLYVVDERTRKEIEDQISTDKNIENFVYFMPNFSRSDLRDHSIEKTVEVPSQLSGVSQLCGKICKIITTFVSCNKC